MRDIFSNYEKMFVGFEPIVRKLNSSVDLLQKATNYPPYNVKKIDENKYLIEIAVAGFGKSDIEVEVVDDTLVVSGNHTADNTIGEYLFKGIGERSFTRKWVLADNIEVKSGSIVNGILQIMLESSMPASKRIKVEVKEEA